MLVNKIKDILQTMEVDWKINEITKSAHELFFVKKTLDMNRSKDVHVCQVTVYVDFEEDGSRYLGQSTTEVAPTMTEEEIKKVLEDAKVGASFVKNAYYELPEPSDESALEISSSFAKDSLSSFMPKLTNALYAPDIHEAGGINSAEIFLTKNDRRIVTSKGIDVSYTSYDNMVEVITDWNDGKEPVESFSLTHYGDYVPEVLTEDVAQLIQDSKDRAHAEDASKLKDIRIILSGHAVKEFLEYFVVKANAKAVYEKISNFEIGQNVQVDGNSTLSGDALNIELLPYLEGSSASSPYDADGVLLKPLTLIKDGILKSYYGENQFTSYLGIPATGRLRNIKVEAGSTSIETFKESPYVELLAFSAFQMNFISGEFGGEFRLGKYYDGEKTVAISGGAISENINQVKATMRFSKEVAKYDNYVGPKHIILEGMELAGK